MRYLKEIKIDVESLSSCPFCVNFKISKNSNASIVELIKSHFISKHTSLLFAKFNEIFPEISTISPKIVSSRIDEGDEELDIYDVTEDEDNLINKLYISNLSDLEKNIIEQVLNGENNLTYKEDKYKCTIEEWTNAVENLKETINMYGYA